ncbi:MAG: hypothetical protein QN168_04115 [Armatimonadota bacterium]|nr:hypothetical protein [Armatimonadota bacterium]
MDLMCLRISWLRGTALFTAVVFMAAIAASEAAPPASPIRIEDA